jgi:hypothetical protein
MVWIRIGFGRAHTQVRLAASRRLIPSMQPGQGSALAGWRSALQRYAGAHHGAHSRRGGWRIYVRLYM